MNIRYLYIIATVFPLLFACKTAQQTASVRPKPIGAGRLLRNVSENAFVYRCFEVKRINCTMDNNGAQTSFRASLRTEKDNYILLSVNKLSLPVAKILLTPDSVKMVNYVDKSWFAGTYAYFRRQLNIDVDFEMLQAIVSNNVFVYGEAGDRPLRDFDVNWDSTMYVLQSFKDRKLDRLDRSDERRERFLRRKDPIVQYLYIDPKLFKMRRFCLDDKVRHEMLNISFDSFSTVNGQQYPSEMRVNYAGTSSQMLLTMKLAGFST
ncbi:MAG: DUF4292 domain-containing protein, partial [Bacteroidales bacterium]|nr:DUF4292 domain-containing protein [Bacteroidales bacterium]